MEEKKHVNPDSFSNTSAGSRDCTPLGKDGVVRMLNNDADWKNSITGRRTTDADRKEVEKARQDAFQRLGVAGMPGTEQRYKEEQAEVKSEHQEKAVQEKSEQRDKSADAGKEKQEKQQEKEKSESTGWECIEQQLGDKSRNDERELSR